MRSRALNVLVPLVALALAGCSSANAIPQKSAAPSKTSATSTTSTPTVPASASVAGPIISAPEVTGAKNAPKMSAAQLKKHVAFITALHARVYMDPSRWPVCKDVKPNEFVDEFTGATTRWNNDHLHEKGFSTYGECWNSKPAAGATFKNIRITEHKVQVVKGYKGYGPYKAGVTLRSSWRITFTCDACKGRDSTGLFKIDEMLVLDRSGQSRIDTWNIYPFKAARVK